MPVLQELNTAKQQEFELQALQALRGIG